MFFLKKISISLIIFTATIFIFSCSDGSGVDDYCWILVENNRSSDKVEVSTSYDVGPWTWEADLDEYHYLSIGDSAHNITVAVKLVKISDGSPIITTADSTIYRGEVLHVITNDTTSTFAIEDAYDYEYELTASPQKSGSTTTVGRVKYSGKIINK